MQGRWQYLQVYFNFKVNLHKLHCFLLFIRLFRKKLSWIRIRIEKNFWIRIREK